ncbi:MAG: hypothetical protein IPJ43_11665 [Saprospiraceae bacterium]|nr:hypothetical protein [Saprospiraceae bacterium]
MGLKDFDYHHQLLIDDSISNLKINWDNSKANRRYFISGMKDKTLFTCIYFSQFWDVSNVDSDHWILFAKK